MLRLLPVFLLFIAPMGFAATPLGTEFTYQGELQFNTGPAEGNFDFEFELFDTSDTEETSFGTVLLEDHPVAEGIFSAALDFGATPFGGDERWLEIRVREAGGGGFTTLTPRQLLTASPFSLQTRGLIVDGSGNIGLGGTVPLYPLHLEFNGSRGIFVKNDSIGASASAIYGEGKAGPGVKGLNTGPTAAVHGENTGSGDGVKGESISGEGVVGLSSSGIGVLGETNSPTKFGVHGVNNAISGNAYGVRGVSDSPTGAAVYGYGNHPTGENAGVHGATRSQAGKGVHGESLTSLGYAGYFSGRFHVEHNNYTPDLNVETNWPVSIENSGVSNFMGGIRLSRDGFFEFTNKARDINANYARLDSTGNWTAVSDRRVKNSIQPLTGSLDKAMALTPVSFAYDNDDSEPPDQHIGFVAQDVQEQFPSLVTNGDLLTLNYSGLSVVAIAALQEQNQVIERLTRENESMKQRLKRIERLLSLTYKQAPAAP